ncbi:amidase family protein [Gemella haemolysans]|uniref:amidase family protein n=1 Tax=Gemella haemolysans TaxID=1379 RepID=UPI0029071122|nr:amidase family protein [Gemella haemolysans]MDU3831421.1 amidase family protein [Gemella haemolysans]
MKKNNIKYVLIPAFAAAALFPVLANDNQAKANEDKAATTSTVNKPETTSEKTASISTTNNVAETTATTPASLANSIRPTTVNNNETTNSASVINNETVKPKAQFTVAEYKQKSALELAQLIRERKVTSTELVDLAYKVIAEENPKLNAVLTTENGKIPKAIVDEAYRTAKEIDNRISAGKLAANPIDWKAQPFLGVPALIKGLDQLKNGDYTNGVYLNKGKIADESGPVAKEFAKLGFVILGQTNYPELGTRNITDSKLFGPAGNPWDPSRNTGGSSGGSAGAVASGMVPIASGSDAGGSIRIPSSWTGLIGLKPTGHVVKFPLVKTIEDAKAYFEKTELSKPKTLVEPPKDLKKLKIAYTLKTPLKDLELSEVAKKAILETVAFLRKEGFTVEEVKEFPIDGYEGIKTYTVGGIGEESYVAAVKGVTEENKRQLDPTTYGLGTSSYMGPNANTDISSVKPLSTFIDQMNAFYKKYDLFLVPTNAVTAPSNDKKVDPYIEPDIAEQLYNINKIKDPKERFNLLTKQWLPMTRRSPYTWVFNLSGNPAISLPTYLSDKNLPFGVMFAAKDNSEKVLLEIGQYFQDKHQFKMNPAIRSSNVSENGKLPNLEINNITLKSKDNNISVDINSKNAENLTLSAKDITKETDLEKLKDKVIADNNNNINHKDQITSIRVVDLELQKDNKTVKLNAPRTVKIALLQNEQNKDILVYHIKQDNSIEFVPSVVTKDSLQFTVDHFSKFAIVAKVNTAFSSNEKAIHSSSVKEEKKVVNTNSTKLDSTPKTLPNTGESTNNFLSAIGLSFLALIGLLKRKNNN